MCAIQITLSVVHWWSGDCMHAEQESLNWMRERIGKSGTRFLRSHSATSRPSHLCMPPATKIVLYSSSILVLQVCNSQPVLLLDADLVVPGRMQTHAHTAASCSNHACFAVALQLHIPKQACVRAVAFQFQFQSVAGQTKQSKAKHPPSGRMFPCCPWRPEMPLQACVRLSFQRPSMWCVMPVSVCSVRIRSCIHLPCQTTDSRPQG